MPSLRPASSHTPRQRWPVRTEHRRFYDPLMSGRTSITLRAHAKINLALAVGPAAPPKGYHPIASWFTCVGLHDELTLTKGCDADASRWSVAWAADAPRPSPIDWPIEKDLAVRAHRLLELTVNRGLPIEGLLVKRTPVGAGLGGGSADAAAALVGINDLFSLGLSRDKLRDLSMTLGSDIAFFIDDEGEAARPALVTGFGERIDRLARLSGHLVLFFPRFGCPTGSVYQAFDRTAPGPLREHDVRALIATPASGLAQAALFNDLATPACDVEPRLAIMQATLRERLRVPVHITGSGSTMFAIARDGADAERLASAAGEACPEVVALATGFV